MPIPELNENELSEHDKQMLDIAENGDPNDPSESELPSEASEKTGDGPELPEGVESVEDLIAKYNELSKPTEGEESTEESDESEASDEGEKPEEGEESESQKYTDVDREKAAYEVAGSKEEYTKLTEWAGENLSEEQVDVYNKVVTQGDPQMVQFATQALQQMAELHRIKTHGLEGEMTTPDVGGADTVSGYESEAQMIMDMSDPRYAVDEAFRAKVAKKLAASQL